MITVRENNPRTAAPRRVRRPWHLRLNTLLRWLHVYSSLFTLFVVLLFSVTGLTLNHPEWSFGTVQKRTEVTGQMPRAWVGPNVTGSKLEIVEFLRRQHGFRGAVSEFRIDNAECTLSFRAPGYAADGFLDRRSGAYQFTVAADGLVAMMNDLHRGKAPGRAWAWVIDLSTIFLVLISLTGFGMLLYLKRTRVSALWTGGVGLALVTLIIWLVGR